MTPIPRSAQDEQRALRLAGLALPAAVWLLGVASPPREGLSPEYLLTLTALLGALVLVDRRALASRGDMRARLGWYLLELVLCFLVVRTHGTLIRPALIFLLPTSRALLLFSERPGLLLSLLVWVTYGINVTLFAWPDRLYEYPNYFSFFLPVYVVALVLTLAIQRQSAAHQRLAALYSDLQSAHDELRQLHERARAAAVAEERGRLAREIHDTLAHYLTVVNVQLEAAEKLAERQPDQARESVTRARRLTLECLQEVRRSVGALRAATLEELALPPALEKLTADFQAATGIGVDLRVDTAIAAGLPVDISQALYRVAQEGLTNVQKHAHAGACIVELAGSSDRVTLRVRDDGTGEQDGNGAAGFGLLGLRERVALLGGTLEFTSTAAGGELRADIPLRVATPVPA